MILPWFFHQQLIVIFNHEPISDFEILPYDLSTLPHKKNFTIKILFMLSYTESVNWPCIIHSSRQPQGQPIAFVAYLHIIIKNSVFLFNIVYNSPYRAFISLQSLDCLTNIDIVNVKHWKLFLFFLLSILTMNAR